MPIGTERLLLRKYEDKDLLDLLEYSSDPEVWIARNLDWKPTEEGVREYWISQRHVEPAFDPEWLALVIRLKALDKVIGNAGIGIIKTGDHKQGTIGWLLGRAYQGKGYATEAAKALLRYGFLELGLHRISARTGMDNIRSWGVMERIGMRREAHFWKIHMVKGQWRDELVYALLAEEWREREEK